MNYEIDVDAAIAEILQELSQLPVHATRWSRTLSPRRPWQGRTPETNEP